MPFTWLRVKVKVQPSMTVYDPMIYDCGTYHKTMGYPITSLLHLLPHLPHSFYSRHNYFSLYLELSKYTASEPLYLLCSAWNFLSTDILRDNGSLISFISWLKSHLDTLLKFNTPVMDISNSFLFNYFPFSIITQFLIYSFF